MENVPKKWIGRTAVTTTDGAAYTFTGRDELTIGNAAHRSELMLRGIFSEAAGKLKFIGGQNVQGDDGIQYAVDATANLTVDDANISSIPAGVIKDPA